MSSKKKLSEIELRIKNYQKPEINKPPRVENKDNITVQSFQEVYQQFFLPTRQVSEVADQSPDMPHKV